MDLSHVFRQLESNEYSITKIYIFLYIAAIGTVLFETRFGSFSKSPSLEAAKFIESAHRLFRLFLKVFLLPAWIDKFYRFKSVQEFYDYFDVLYNFGDMCIKKKLSEIQGRLDKGDIQDEDAAEFLTFLISREDISFKEITSNLIELLFPAIETVCISWKVYKLSRINLMNASNMTIFGRKNLFCLPEF